MVIESATAHLKSGLDLEQWQPPISGVENSEIRFTRSNAALDGVLFQAISSFSSLYKGKLIDNGLSDYNGDEPEEDDAEEMAVSLIKQVKLLLPSEKYNKHWNKEVRVKSNSKVTIDYLGVHYNANISNFNVKKINSAYFLAKSKLLDLDVLREKRQSELIDSKQEFELLISLNKKANNQAKDLAHQLEEIADSIELIVINKQGPTEIANRIAEKDAA